MWCLGWLVWIGFGLLVVVFLLLLVWCVVGLGVGVVCLVFILVGNGVFFGDLLLGLG